MTETEIEPEDEISHWQMILSRELWQELHDKKYESLKRQDKIEVLLELVADLAVDGDISKAQIDAKLDELIEEIGSRGFSADAYMNINYYVPMPKNAA